MLLRDCPVLGRSRFFAIGLSFPTVSPYKVCLLIQQDPAAVNEVSKESSAEATETEWGSNTLTPHLPEHLSS